MKNSFRKIFFTIVIFFSFSFAHGQIFHPINWSFSTEQKNEKEAILIFTAKIEKGWHLYSQNIPEKNGPVPTSFSFQKNDNYELIGKVSEVGKAEEVDDPNFGMRLKYFSNQSTFKQKIKIKNIKEFKVSGELTFMTCDNQRCLPPETIPFKFDINAIKKHGVILKDASSNLTTPPSQEISTIDTSSPANDTVTATDISSNTPVIGGCGEDANTIEIDVSLWRIFIGGILGGLLALLTPCVFPMIPLTVSFFIKKHGTHLPAHDTIHKSSSLKGFGHALIYGLSIIIIYVGLGFLITVTLGSDALNEMASSVVFNMLFFIIFMIFAISFFGAFEITLPHSWANLAFRKSEQGGLMGIFFMAFTLSLVSFSCTGPIIGTLLVEAAHTRNYLGPLMGMGGFSLALALPFALFAAFPSWLHSLPKSGGWLNTVKVSLGFIELALALKFFSNVDLAYHWGLLKREMFIALWIIIFGMLGFYLLGKLRFAHDSEARHISIPRLIFAIITLTFTVYLIPGIWGAPLKMISGFPPPDFYKEWITAKATSCPHDLNCFHDYDEGMEYAKRQNKPVILDFTGWSCVNCRKMEDNVWSDAKVLKRLSEQYVLISLYVDDKEPLPKSEQKISPFSGKLLKTAGNKWSDFQASTYNTNSQPYYVLLDNQGKLLTRPKGYTPDIPAYIKFLDEGLCSFYNRQGKR